MRRQAVNETRNITESALGNLFIMQLKDMYWAEKHLLKTVQEMHKAATLNTLRLTLDDHHTLIQHHVSRLEHILGLLDTDKKVEKCMAMAGIIDKCETVK